MLCGTFLLLLSQLGPSSLNEGWRIYKIVVVLTAVVFVVSASSDPAIDPEFSW